MSDLAAAMLGAAVGARTFLAPAVLAPPGRWRLLVRGAALGELIADKQPDMGPRTAPRGLVFRVVSAALCGRAAGGARGSAIAVGVAVPAAYALSAARVDGRLNAYAEDALTIVIASAASARRG